MSSEMTIEQLVDQFRVQGYFKPYKFKVTPEQSRKFQKLFFEAGGHWNGDSVEIDTANPHLYVFGVTLTHCNDEEWFVNHSHVYTEIKIKGIPFVSQQELFAYLSITGNAIIDCNDVVIFFEENGQLNNCDVCFDVPQYWRPYTR